MPGMPSPARSSPKGTGGTSQVKPKVANTMKVKAKSPKVSAKKLKKKAKKLAVTKVLKVSGAQGEVTFKKAGKGTSAKIKVARDGTVKLPKKLKKGTYRFVVAVTAAGDETHDAATVKVKVKLRVK